MKLTKILKEYSISKDYIRGIQFKVLININSQECKISYIPKTYDQVERLQQIGKESVAKTILEKLNKKLAMNFRMGSSQDADISFVTTLSELEEHLLLMLK